MIVLSVRNKESFSQSVEELSEILSTSNSEWLIAFIFVLMLVNWLTEAVKWKLLAGKITPVSFSASVLSVFTGITVSFFTPNRVGEFAGRVLHLPFKTRIKGSVASVIGSMSQLLITLIAGGLSIVFMTQTAVENENTYFSFITAVTLVALIVLIVLYFNLGNIYKWLHQIKWLKKADAYIEVLSLFNFRDLLKVAFFSIIRYAVFTFQFILLLHVFGISFGWINEAAAISMIFLVLAIIPTFAVTEVITRSSVTVYFLAQYSNAPEPVIIAASFFLWIINLAIPSVLGALSLLKIRVSKHDTKSA